MPKKNYVSATQLFMQDIDLYPVLSEAEQSRLLMQYYQLNDQDSRNKILLHNQKLLLHFLKSYKNIKQMEFDDVIQEANLEFIKCLSAYDPNRVALSTHLEKYIKVRLNRLSFEKKYLHSRHFAIKVYQYQRLIQEYEKKGQALPKDEEIRKILKITQNTLDQIRNEKKYVVKSYNEPVTDNSDYEFELLDSIENPTNVFASLEQQDDQLRKRQLLLVIKSILTPNEYFVLYYRTIQAVPPKYIKDALHQSRTNIDNLFQKACARLKEYFPMDDSPKFKQRLEEIMNQYQDQYNNLNEYPINLDDILKFYFLAPMFDETEKIIYYQKEVLKNNFDANYFEKIYHISKEEYQRILQSINQRIQDYFEENIFQNWCQAFWSDKENSVFKNINCINKKNDLYLTWLRKYKTLTFDEILTIVKQVYQTDIIPDDIRNKSCKIEKEIMRKEQNNGKEGCFNDHKKRSKR